MEAVAPDAGRQSPGNDPHCNANPTVNRSYESTATVTNMAQVQMKTSDQRESGAVVKPIDAPATIPTPRKQSTLNDYFLSKSLQLDGNRPTNERPKPSSTFSETASISESSSDKAVDDNEDLEIEASTSAEVPQKSTEFQKPASKKMRKDEDRGSSLRGESDTISLEQMLLPIKNLIDDPTQKFVLEYTEFQSFLEEIHGNPKPLDVARKFTSDIEGLIQMLDTVYMQVENRSLKNRITRLKKKIVPPKDDSFDYSAVPKVN
ncbi:hypothetical protein QAD02_007502 [Eretmocerus hayati]|uniref:Uncharacterized protein n=1 Tax=Eretmocerus hayati TaxID=131215 RepID=A0ACC2N3U3_9HYME|nr:hypothetical protein QAD02_007502 [Eretmocerus hayati]